MWSYCSRRGLSPVLYPYISVKGPWSSPPAHGEMVQQNTDTAQSLSGSVDSSSLVDTLRDMHLDAGVKLKGGLELV